MSVLTANQQQLIAFTLLNSSGVEVTGLGSTYILTLSKNGSAFVSGAGVKAEIGSGWYSYQLTADETDTPGPLAIVVTGAGVDQLNLLYEIRPYYAEEPSGTNILTAAEAANVLRCDTTDPLMLALLPSVDAYVKHATGRAWEEDTTIEPLAKAAAMILITQWHENPGMSVTGQAVLSAGLTACLMQLEAQALILETTGVPSEALKLVGSAPESGEAATAIGIRPLLVFNHEMASGSTSSVALKTAAGVAVAATNTLDVTKKRMTITPTSSLAAATDYQVILTDAADIYGATLTEIISFKTAG
jgi:hypothetical protein